MSAASVFKDAYLHPNLVDPQILICLNYLSRISQSVLGLLRSAFYVMAAVDHLLFGNHCRSWLIEVWIVWFISYNILWLYNIIEL